MSEEEETSSASRLLFSTKGIFIFAGLIAFATIVTVMLFFGALFTRLPGAVPQATVPAVPASPAGNPQSY